MSTVKPVYKLLNVCDDLKWTTKHTCDTIFTHFQGITNNIYGFGGHFLLLYFFTRPPIFLPIHIRFYPSKSNDVTNGRIGKYHFSAVYSGRFESDRHVVCNEGEWGWGWEWGGGLKG